MANNEEDIRRKRRIQQQKQRERQRKKQLRRQVIALMIMVLTIIVILVSVIISSIIKWNKERQDDNVLSQTEEIASAENDLSQTDEADSADDALSQTEETVSLEGTTSSDESSQVELTQEEKKQYVNDHPEEYTEDLINFINKYDQTIDYVYYYKDRESISLSATSVDDQTETAFPLLMQWDARWGYEEYGDSLIGVAGCGPTSLTMVYEGLTGNTDQTPDTVGEMSERSGYCVSGGGSTWELMTKGASELGLNSQELPLYEGKMIEELEKGHPIITNVGPGDFTEGGHFIVITGYKDGKFMVNDPNSRENSSTLWDYSVLEPQIKNLWSFWV